jgi:2-dehydrotetronate isomerase
MARRLVNVEAAGHEKVISLPAGPARTFPSKSGPSFAMPRFSANLGFLWVDRPLLDRIDAAARAGFKAVELHYPYDVPASDVRKACNDNGVVLLGINTNIGAGPDGHRGLAAVPGREAEFEALADQALGYCHAAGGTAVHVMAGLVPEGRRAAAADVFVANLQSTARKAAERDLTILLEPLNRRDMPGYFYSKVEEAIAIIDRVGAPNVKLMFDVYHVGVSQGDVLTRLRAHLARIGHVQVAAVPSRAEPDEGEIAFGAIFRELDALGYGGWVGCEYIPRGGTDDGLGWVQKLGVSL